MAEHEPLIDLVCCECQRPFKAEPHHRVCPPCVEERLADYEDEGYQDDECGQCGGEGFIFDCFDGCCLNAEEGCDLCTRRCDWCNRLSPKELRERAELGKVLGDALAKQKPE